MISIKLISGTAAFAGFLALAAPPTAARAATLAFADSETAFTLCGPNYPGAPTKNCVAYQLGSRGSYHVIGLSAAVPLANAHNSTTLSFSTSSSNQQIFITYNSECYLPYGSITISIIVDGVTVRPQSGQTTFCSNYTNYGAIGMATRVVTYGVSTPGTHSVSVIATLDSSGTVASLADSIITVQD